MSYRDDKIYVLNNVPERDLLEQLAEEACELSQAALKAIRAMGMSFNPTPIDEEEAVKKLVEEAGDVIMLFDALLMFPCESMNNPKWHRWAERIRKEKKHGTD